jgi:hypothetical protein
VKTSCARLRLRQQPPNCTSSRSTGRSQGRRSRRAPAHEPLTASWRGGYQRYIRTPDFNHQARGLKLPVRGSSTFYSLSDMTHSKMYRF